jgi:BirA family transcriptional regulator, biotin operon repressor / biotin---[acetyl-CoA-carboxylase] ligase
MLEPPLGLVLWLDEVGSTQDEARRSLDQLADASIIAARRQVAGRGRQGRSWLHSEHGVAFTYVHRPHAPLAPMMALRLPLLVGLALHTVLQAEDAKLSLKWPNDLLRGRRDGDAADGSLGPWRKVAGILVEGVGVSTTIDAVLIGVGINLVDPKDTLQGIAGGLKRQPSSLPEQMLAMVHHSIAAHLPLLAPPLWPSAINRIRRSCMTIGTPVLA